MSRLPLTTLGYTHRSVRIFYGLGTRRDALLKSLIPLAEYSNMSTVPQAISFLIQNSIGDTARISYFDSPAHYIRAFTDARGIVVQEALYDTENRLSGIRDASGALTVQRYDLANQTEVIADRLGSESIVTFDIEGNITSVTDPLGNKTSTIYNGAEPSNSGHRRARKHFSHGVR